MPILSMAFRPLYLLGALSTIVTLVLWGVGIFPPFPVWVSEKPPLLTGLYWHGHEMIWGFAGAIVVGFLHTAVTNWTGFPPLAGWRLAAVVLFWLLTRIAAPWATSPWPIAVPAALYWLTAAASLATRLWRRRQRQNYPIPFFLLFLGGLEIGLVFSLASGEGIPMRFLEAGVFTVAALIGLIGQRVIPFFTSRALAIPQVAPSVISQWLGVWGTLFVAVSLAFPLPLPATTTLACGAALALGERLWRWYHPAIWSNPMVWVLHLGFAATALGIALFGLSAGFAPQLRSAALHIVTVGGLGWMILGMITRTTLGHTGGDPNAAPVGMSWAFMLVGVALLLRLLAVVFSPLAGPLLALSAVGFAAALGCFLWHFAGRLLGLLTDHQGKTHVEKRP